jgi:hypothetical protein
VDEFGRAVIPESFRFSVAMLDANGNLVLRFGEYGNADQKGTGSSRPDPAIPLANPMYVQKVGDHVYISDVGSQRVVRADLYYTDWATTNGILIAEGPAGALRSPPMEVYPMPFEPGVNISFDLPSHERIRLAVYTPAGRLVRMLSNANLNAGHYLFRWDGRTQTGSTAAAGLYVMRMESKRGAQTKNLILAK